MALEFTIFVEPTMSSKERYVRNDLSSNKTKESFNLRYLGKQECPRKDFIKSCELNNLASWKVKTTLHL